MPKKYNYLGYLLNMSRKFGEDLPSSFLKPLVNVFQFLHANSHWKKKERNNKIKSIKNNRDLSYAESLTRRQVIFPRKNNGIQRIKLTCNSTLYISIASLKVIWRSIHAFQMTSKGNKTQPYQLPGWENLITYTTNL